MRPKEENDDEHWLVYDPNYVNGAKTVAKQDLAETINQSLRDLVSVEDV